MKLTLRLMQISSILILAALPISAQTSTELAANYGPPMTAYQIRSDFLLLVRHAEDGHACEMRIQPFNFNDIIPNDAAREILDEAVPIAMRGTKDSRIAVGMVGTTGTMSEQYENVAISTIKIFRESCMDCIVRIEVRWKNRICKQG